MQCYTAVVCFLLTKSVIHYFTCNLNRFQLREGEHILKEIKPSKWQQFRQKLPFSKKTTSRAKVNKRSIKMEQTNVNNQKQY
jgi:hypothetical protein